MMIRNCFLRIFNSFFISSSYFIFTFSLHIFSSFCIRTINTSKAMDDHIESSPVPSPTPLDYTPGSLVWAKLFGHPYWPAIIEADPDLGEFHQQKGSNQDIRPMGWRQRLKG
ncbi:DNA mismatch repair protein Msh6-like [Argiope bruennichi]|uniref:DNA mismatch repair protein Msh6-like n=1 Tax=Argiope bruennichi TaxID=94029 RepID=UPI0024949719|nr:DNA mismatch repair protein Msh6-like [Argiope bruennichi]